MDTCLENDVHFRFSFQQKAPPASVSLINCLIPDFRSRKSESGENGSGANAAVWWWCDDGTDEAERSGQDDGVPGVHVSQVQGVHTYSGLVDWVVERWLLCHVVVGKWRRAGEVHGLSLDSVKDTYCMLMIKCRHTALRTKHRYSLGEVKENAQDDQ